MAGFDHLLGAIAFRLAALVFLGLLVKSLPDAPRAAAACVPAASVEVGLGVPGSWERSDKSDQLVADMVLHD